MERKFLSAMRALLLKDNTLFFSIKMYSKKRNNGIFMHYGSQRAGQRLGTYFFPAAREMKTAPKYVQTLLYSKIDFSILIQRREAIFFFLSFYCFRR